MPAEVVFVTTPLTAWEALSSHLALARHIDSDAELAAQRACDVRSWLRESSC